MSSHPALDAALAGARREWPEVDVPTPTIAAWIASRLGPDVELGGPTGAARVADLYIACACAAGDPRAITAFERRYFSEVVHAARRSSRLRRSEEEVEQLAQMVRERLFVSGPGGAPPRIAEYGGRGAIRSWLRVVATRIVLNLVAKPERETPTDAEALADIATGDGDVELEHLKRVYRADFKAAVDDALTKLDAKDRNILSYSFAQRLSIDQLGAVYGVHRATAARWVAKARESFVDETRRSLMLRLGADDAEVDSIVRLIQSRFDITLGGLMGHADEG